MEVRARPRRSQGGRRDEEDRGKRAPCPHFPDCVACPFIGRAYGEQLAAKRERLRVALAGYDALGGLEVPEVRGAPHSFGYRNQAKLVARRARRGLLLGVYRPGTHQVVDVRRCATHHPLLTQTLEALAGLIERYEVPAYDERSREGFLRYVVVRVSAWKRLAQVILVVRKRGWASERDFLRAVRELRRVGSVVLNLNPDPGNVVLGREMVAVTRETALVDRVGGLELKIRAGSFVQANLPAARRAYELVLQWADPRRDENAVDLYCGVGAISLSVATRARAVWGIEESPAAVLDARDNVRINGFHNVRFLAGDAGTLLGDLAGRLGHIDLVTLNPPRKGADGGVRAAIVGCAPARIVYMSCEPESLARDLDWFAAHGYRTERLQPFDFLPQTDHVETVALLARG